VTRIWPVFAPSPSFSQRSAGATLGHSSTTPLGKSASLKAVGGGSSGSASAGKSATQTQLHKTAPARHGHGHDQIEPEDYVPKSFDFPDSDDEGGESAPAAGGH
jgi:hypothetical protein